MCCKQQTTEIAINVHGTLTRTSKRKHQLKGYVFPCLGLTGISKSVNAQYWGRLVQSVTVRRAGESIS